MAAISHGLINILVFNATVIFVNKDIHFGPEEAGVIASVNNVEFNPLVKRII